jgi:hypothetical protein
VKDEIINPTRHNAMTAQDYCPSKIIDRVAKRRLLLFGITGSLISVLADISLTYFPKGIGGFESTFTISVDKVYTVLENASHIRLLLSNYLATIGIPLGVFGLWHMFRLAQPAGKFIAPALFITGAIGYIAGTVFHASLSYLATLYRIKRGATPEVEEALTGIISLFQHFSQPLAYVFFGAILIVSILFAVAVLSRKTVYPRWMIAVNPVTIELVFALLAGMAPLNLKTFLAGTVYNSSLFVFYLVSVVALSQTSLEPSQRMRAVVSTPGAAIEE